MATLLTTDAVAPGQRVAYWQDMVCQTFVQAQCESRIGTSFRGSISTEAFDRAEISRIEAGPQRIHRRPVDIARTSKPRYYLCYHTAGQARYSDRHGEALLGPGDMILLDNCEPYSAEYQAAVTSVVLHLPHELLRERFRLPERLLGRRLSGARGITRVAGEFIQSSLSQASQLSMPQRATMADMALNLVSGVLAEEAGMQADTGAHQAVLVARIKQSIHRQLRDPALTPDKIAAGMGLSVRYVSRLFQHDGLSLGRYLLQQRVERCRCALSNPLLAGIPVSTIALENGFNNFAHFSRVFRDALGCSPTEHRKRMIPPR